jgi:hypothetical protein
LSALFGIASGSLATDEDLAGNEARVLSGKDFLVLQKYEAQNEACHLVLH